MCQGCGGPAGAERHLNYTRLQRRHRSHLLFGKMGPVLLVLPLQIGVTGVKGNVNFHPGAMGEAGRIGAARMRGRPISLPP